MGIKTMRKLLPAIVLLVAFFCVSFFFINEPSKKQRSEYHSSELNQVVTKNGNVIRTDYIDDDGKLCIAADIGYATLIAEQQNDNSVIEIYFDDQGKRINRYAGYYGVLREFDEAGNNIRITYLDANNAPYIMSLNYAVEERTFNEFGQQVSCRYLDVEGNPVLSDNNSYGVRYEYDNIGRRVKITYVDDSDEPMIMSSGYSILVREYYDTDDQENGRVRKELYYLPDGSPASLGLDQYGIYKEYDENGLTSLITYLDADGFPMITNKGYTTVTYTYYADNSVQSTLYYDINGNPFQMSEGQYGTKNKRGQTVYLNADGTEKFNVKTFIYNESKFVIFIAIILVVLSAAAGKKLNWLMLFAYIGVIAYFTLMYRETSEPQIGILNSYRNILASSEARTDILRNIWLFIPLGMIVFQLSPRTTILLVPVLLSIIIETVQYITGSGMCELDDVISNGFGSVVGYGMGYLVPMIRGQLHRKGNLN